MAALIGVVPDEAEVDRITGKRITKINETIAEIEPKQGSDGFLFVQREVTGRLLWFEDGTACWEGLNQYKSRGRIYYRPKSFELKIPERMKLS